MKKAHKLISCNDYEDLTNKYMENILIHDNSSKDILKYYLVVIFRYWKS
jgi:hypothetical protein